MDVFGFAEHRTSHTRFRKKIKITKNTDNSVLNLANSTTNAKIKFNVFEWYVPIYTHKIEKQKVIPKQNLNKIPTDFQYVERSVFLKVKNTRKLWTFEMGTQERTNVPIWIIVNFQQRD